MKTHVPHIVQKSAKKRFAEWNQMICPYCGESDGEIKHIEHGGIRCNCYKCGAENKFSGPMVKRLKG